MSAASNEVQEFKNPSFKHSWCRPRCVFSANNPIERNGMIAPYTGIESLVPISENYVLEVKKNRFINANRNIDTTGFANDCWACNKRNNECRNCLYILIVYLFGFYC